ncbi:DNA-binding transcriptional regulator, AcrR family [Saccharopolyspora antimicrobica]|uniref:DNA-binding transcriptional regulator, AcrR family n=1 Tax=Saccharopolyspora antimicrobica TaxID=455193 RepID=A0A1I4XB32_9PSEU|nr:TetR/AcrR family transcriptional regulator [Saccharopolyspora antimicrobica]RKT84424.1 TetR family transcriptional regulator [Saccharopolyspora antimicrobica]SFN23128.1 DNA-binding transcriptional regulator, AcrR family [Saccharopolyspora antimicrobica]
MTGVTRRERLRAATEQDIRQHARALLVDRGSDAVTLRAIARELGITAPALYRYYESREDLLRQLCDDICTDLAAELHRASDEVGAEFVDKIFAVCREFRRWALAHPEEFALVFASPRADADQRRPDRFADVFLGIVGPFLAEGAILVGPAALPVELPDLSSHQESLAAAFSTAGIELPPEALRPDVMHFLLRWWVRLYGHVALEVFGRFPFDLKHADRLFEAMLHELTRETGFA